MSGRKQHYGIKFEPASSARPRVAEGTPCAPCQAKGHFCAAYEMDDGRAVCPHCLDGVDCPKTPRGGFRSVAGPPKPLPEHPAEPSQAGARGDVAGRCIAGNAGPAACAAVGSSMKKVDKSIDSGEKLLKSAGKMAQLSEKCAAEGYRVVTLADLPGRKYRGVYDELFAEFVKLPKLAVLTRRFDNREIANTYMLALVRIGRSHGLKMRQKQDRSTIYVWQE